MSEISKYIAKFDQPISPVLKEIELQNVIGDVIYPTIGPLAGQFLYAFVLAMQPQLIVELGTGCGYATICLAKAAATYGGEVITVEIDSATQQRAMQNLQRAQLADYVTFVLEDASTWLAKHRDIADMLLQDTSPSLYKELLNPCIECLKEGATLFTHDALVPFHNAPEPLNTEMTIFNQVIMNHPDIRSTLLPLDDGLWMSVKISTNKVVVSAENRL